MYGLSKVRSPCPCLPITTICHSSDVYYMYINHPSHIMILLHRHDRYENQYRAMFVNNCTIKYNTRVVPPEAGGGKHSTKHKVNEEEKEKTGEEGISTAATDIEGAQDQPQQQAK